MEPILLGVLLLFSNSIYAQNESAFAGAADNKAYANVIEAEEDLVKTTPSPEKRDTSSVEVIPADVVNNAPVPERTLTTKGIAIWLDNPLKENFQNFYALHKYLPNGTIIKVINPMNDRVIEVKVVGKLPDLQEYENINLMVSAATARQLNVLDAKFIVRMVIPVSAIHASAKK